MAGAFVAISLVLGLIGIAVASAVDPAPLPQRTPIAGSQPELNQSSTTTTEPGTTSSIEQSGPSTTVTTAPAEPGSIEVGSHSLDFGATATSGTLQITNPGGQPVAFEVSTGAEAIALKSGGGELAPGETIDFQVSLDRDEIGEGEISETITLSWPDGEIEIAVVGAHEDNPIIHNPQASPSTVQTNGDGTCTPTTSVVTARIRDSSEFTAIVRWSPDGTTTRETAMTDTGNDIYSAEIGPFNAPPSAQPKIVATDVHGNAGGASVPLTVESCP